MLDAEFGLAKLYKQELSGSERSYVKENGNRGAESQYSSLVDKLVARVPVVGYEVVKQDVKSIHGQFQSWILLKLPYEQFNKVLQEQKAEAFDKSVKDAFDDLETRVRTRVAERAAERKADQDARRQELESRANLVSAAVGAQKAVQVSPTSPVPEKLQDASVADQ